MTEENKASVEEYLKLADANDVDGANAFIEKHFGKAGEENYDEDGYKEFAENVIAASVARITETKEVKEEHSVEEAEASEEVKDEVGAE